MRILVLDDHIAVGEGTRAILEAELNCHVEVFTEPDTALSNIEREKFDVYLIDYHLSDMDGLEFVEQLLQIHTDAVIIIYTGHKIENYFVKLWSKGVTSFINKTDSRKQLIDSILYAQKGKIIIERSTFTKILQSNRPIGNSVNTLTEREIEILKFVEVGYTNKAIALDMNLSQRSIEKSLTTIFFKLGVDSRVEAVIKWKELNQV